MGWFLLQGAIVLLTVWSNQTWHWADATLHVAIAGMALAWLGTKIAMAIINVARGRPSNSLIGW